MAEIKCPKCGEIIKLDKSEYDALLNDVAQDEVNRQVLQRVADIEAKLKAQYQLENSKDKATQEKTIDALKQEIAVLNEQVKNFNTETKLQVSKALEEAKDLLAKREAEIVKLKGDVVNATKDAQLREKELKEQHQAVVAHLTEERDEWKKYRLGDSTKDLGESLEVYCANAFNNVRAFAFPNAYFEKDNDSSEGSKGDYIFRDFSTDNIELTSIMFDMKNEKDDTEHKHKNEDFFKKLDADRTKKGCEYAVLVTTLEKDSDLYNAGIVDVSYKYPKMFVIRPQFFVSFIGLIRNMAMNNYAYKKEVIEYRNENLDISTFQDKVNTVIEKINGDYEKAGKIYGEVDNMCDGMIAKIEAFRKQFHTAANHIGAAVNQLDNLSVKKLTYGNKTMKQKFAELDSGK